MLCHPGSSSTPPERQLRTLNREEPLNPKTIHEDYPTNVYRVKRIHYLDRYQ